MRISFRIQKKHLTAQQATHTRYHFWRAGAGGGGARHCNYPQPGPLRFDLTDGELYRAGQRLAQYGSGWAISETEDHIEGCTYLDNFDMPEFLGVIGVTPNVIDWNGIGDGS